ncbi:hypothetical protein [Amycolatopsis sp. CA-230715]|uniref:hypothetical protein n=1 Tax=Amycolatopsis sp. CA-230715 TaxID=2745196 RepID=UPI001C0143E2|nr:hypothetical protein [Amycolatopsis sp. CA-230715]
MFKDEFYETDQFRAAFKREHIGAVFRAYRNHPHWLRSFGKGLNQEVLGRWLNMNQAQISRIENAPDSTEYTVRTLRGWVEALNIPRRLCWFYHSEESGQRAGPIVAAVGPLQLPDSNGAGLRPTIDTSKILRVGKLADARLHFEKMYRNSGGLVARVRLEQYLARHSSPLIAMNSGSDPTGVEHQRAIGALIALTGVCAYDSEDWTAANSYFLQALNIAQALGDRSFQGYVLALMTNQALALEDYRTAEDLSKSALSLLDEGTSSLAVDLQVMNVKSLAFQAEKSAALRAIHNLESHFSSNPATASIAEASYAQTGHLHAGIAEALMSLGDYQAAEQYAETSIKSGSHARGKVNQLASLATLEIAKGEIERASSLATKMVETSYGMESRRLIRRFVEIRNSLAKGAPSVARDAIDMVDNAVALLV